MARHYLFEPEFCNPALGWEKGQVEKNVQDARHRLWQPTPRFGALIQPAKPDQSARSAVGAVEHRQIAPGRVVTEVADRLAFEARAAVIAQLARQIPDQEFRPNKAKLRPRRAVKPTMAQPAKTLKQTTARKPGEAHSFPPSTRSLYVPKFEFEFSSALSNANVFYLIWFACINVLWEE
jgi:hypothetical protein